METIPTHRATTYLSEMHFVDNQKYPLYLDYNATTPVDPRVAQAMLPYLQEQFGNPSSSHVYGRQARAAVERARAQLAQLLGCSEDEIIFTSGGTESNNLALLGAAQSLSRKGRHIITTRVEHPAVVEPCLKLLESGFDVTFIKVDSTGRVLLEDIEASLRADTILVSVMHANNEVGTIQPIADIARLTRGRGVVLHTDAAQSVGKVPTRVDELGVDLLTVAGHKFYAPKGVGALYVRTGVPLLNILYGAGQERGFRPGTENVLEIVGLGKAAEIAGHDLDNERRRIAGLRDHLQQKLLRALPFAVVNGHPEERLPNTLSIAFPGLTADGLLSRMTGIAASAGAACHSDKVKISHVLDAMNLDPQVAQSTIRLSLGRFTTQSQVDQAAGMIIDTVRSLT